MVDTKVRIQVTDPNFEDIDIFWDLDKMEDRIENMRLIDEDVIVEDY